MLSRENPIALRLTYTGKNIASIIGIQQFQ